VPAIDGIADFRITSWDHGNPQIIFGRDEAYAAAKDRARDESSFVRIRQLDDVREHKVWPNGSIDGCTPESVSLLPSPLAEEENATVKLNAFKLDSLSVAELKALQERIGDHLGEKIEDEKRRLEGILEGVKPVTKLRRGRPPTF